MSAPDESRGPAGPNLPPLLSEEDRAAVAPPSSKAARRASAPSLETLKKKALGFKHTREVGLTLALAGVFMGAAIAFSALRPINPPAPLVDPLNDVLGFVLLDSDFNRLPLERRLELAKELAQRMRELDAGDSAMMAAFAAGLGGQARKQLEDNLTTMTVDLIDSYAQKYTQAPLEQRMRVLEEALVELLALRQDLDPTGFAGDRSPEEQLQRFRERSTERARRREGQGGSTNIDRSRAESLLVRVESDVNERTSPGERARTVRFMRDTVRYLRGQDIATGKPQR